jgi:hypothetical protein
MIVYFTTVKRKRPVRDAGDLVCLDWTTKKVLKTIPIFPFDPDIVDDPNPRGNSRGGKGIIVSGNELLVATYHSILVFDLELNLKRKISSNLFVNIHEMCMAGEDIWVASTAIDAAVLVNREGSTLRSWWPREETLLQEKYGLCPMAIDKNIDNRLIHIHSELSGTAHHTHLNSVVRSGANTYVLLNKQGLLVRIEPQCNVVLEDSWLRGAHSPAISIAGDRLLLCSSFKKSILVYDLASGKAVQKIDLLKFADVEKLHQAHPDQPFNQSLFVRGLEIIDEKRILAGISPAAVLEIDIGRGRLLDLYQHSADIADAVHGLRLRSTAEMKPTA